MNAKRSSPLTEKTSPLMFDRIASRYDKLNRVMTFGLDKSWRQKISAFMPTSITHWLDAATGTGDQILFCLNQNLPHQKITGIDLSSNMLDLAKAKLEAFPQVDLKLASITDIPLQDYECDVITCSFGIRNVDPFTDALDEFFRVLKSGGSILILESSRPDNAFIRMGHFLYMKYMLPLLARFFGTEPEAYSYLAKTTSKFPCGEAFCTILKSRGFIEVKGIPMSFGSVTLYHAKKP
jgi:demethylmenaquinone methyltransferase/2-methoxy-6-polyprenyl-1,4-benzoquinol methylase